MQKTTVTLPDCISFVFSARARRLLAGFLVAAGAAGAAQGQVGAADLVLHNGKIWTVDEANPQAEAVAVRGERIIAVGTSREILALKGPSTRVVDLEGRRVLPGFNDAHTHFENATEWFYRVNLHDVNDQAEFDRRLAEAVARVPEGFWITGGDWATAGGFEPELEAIDRIAPRHPVLLRNSDREFFANSMALRHVRLDKRAPDPRGGRYGRDPTSGDLSGMLYGTAGDNVQAMLPPISLEQKLVSARNLMRQLNGVGITSVSDISRIDAMSQRQTYHTHVERSFSDIGIFQALRDRGELTVRVFAMLPLTVWREAREEKLFPGSGDAMIRFGTLKALADASLMHEPFANRPGYAGGWSFRVRDEAELRRDILDADGAGFDLGVHVLGDRAVQFLTDAYADAIAANGPRDRRLRVIHAWYATPEDLARIGAMGMIVDVTPSHLSHEWKQLDASLGPSRVAGAHAWRTLIDHGAVLNIVSDMPGGFVKGNMSPFNPFENIYYAVTRQDMDGLPEGGWRGDQRLTLAEAVRAYTLNPAYSAREDGLKGSITVGKLADMVVVSQDIFSIEPRELLNVEAIMTVMGGVIVHERK
ncbi:amidohydrolase [Luteimonas marina]|uniref:Amidohydrolase n=1 Tax=Luteimonas marina TaxID=488485 RepID=A0A5C5TYC8_9GAMM|nr:amidohydrolase [Luteimonas marina]TWT18716.1 amidohydrolase [Luteimonas marina]